LKGHSKGGGGQPKREEGIERGAPHTYFRELSPGLRVHLPERGGMGGKCNIEGRTGKGGISGDINRNPLDLPFPLSKGGKKRGWGAGKKEKKTKALKRKVWGFTILFNC